MSKRTMSESKTSTQEFHDALMGLELNRIMGKKGAHDDRVSQSLWGLALSGGGIRSATYCLGVLQALSKRGMLGAFHYCSTVSGGGYIGGFLQALLDKEKNETDPVGDVARMLLGEQRSSGPGVTTRAAHLESSATSEAVRKLRRYSNFLSPNKRPLSGDRIALVAAYLSNMLLTQLQLLSLVFFLVFVPYLMVRVLQVASYSPIAAWLIAVIVIVIALASRPRRMAAEQHARAGKRPGPLPFAGADIVPPAGLSIGFVLLAGLVWPVAGEDGVGNQAVGAVDLMAALSRMTGIKALAEPEWFAPVAVASAYLIGFVTWLIWWFRGATRVEGFGRRLGSQLVFGSLACVAIAGAIVLVQPDTDRVAGVVSPLAMDDLALWDRLHQLGNLAPYGKVAFGASALFAIFFVINLLHLALAYDRKTDIVSRERWNRLMGRTAVWLFAGVAGTLAITCFVPHYLRGFLSNPEVAGGLAVAWGSVSVGGAIAGYWEQASKIARGLGPHLKRALLAIALWVFLGGIVVAMGMVVGELVAPPSGEEIDLGGFKWMVVAFLGWWVLALFVDENEFSMNGFYRNRLVRCYLAARNDRNVRRDIETGLNPDRDDIELRQLRDYETESERQRPLYPLLCGAVNLVRSSRLEWQDRKAASFVFSPLFCGHQSADEGQAGPIGDVVDLPNRVTTSPAVSRSDIARRHTLGAAMAVSGAALSSNMGYHSSPAVSALLTLFNVRLGWWVINRNAKESVIDFAGLNLLSELLSNTHENGKYVYVTDGGHFENLGIYELVRRKCRFIVSVDATADHERRFGDLANAVHKCRVDFGAEIDIDTSLMQSDDKSGHALRCAALGRVTYADGSEGFLLYLKPTLLGDESADVRNYARIHEKFPHEPTSDQFFDEIQFECYRQLGFQNMLSLIERISQDPPTGRADNGGGNGGPNGGDGGGGPGSDDGNGGGDDGGKNPRAAGREELRMRLTDYRYKEEFLKRIKYRLYEPSDAVSLRRTQHGDALVRLLERLRESLALKGLDIQLYPGLHRYNMEGAASSPRVSGAPGTPMTLPPPEAFRDSFYYMQQLIVLMESVHGDLDLDRNWNHPDNRGWMNLFQHWSWVPMFRLTWALTLQTRGARFVHFCERRLEVPPITRDLLIEFSAYRRRGPEEGDAPRWGAEFAGKIDRLRAAGRINFLEEQLLHSKGVKDIIDRAIEYKVGVVWIRTSEFLARGGAHGLVENLPVGIVLITRAHGAKEGEFEINVLRVQDHLRRMGLGFATVKRLVLSEPGATWSVRTISGDCGKALDFVTEIVAAKHDKRIARFLDQVQLMLASPGHG